MHTLLIFAGGCRADALLLSASSDRLRVIIPGRSDAMELNQVDGRWLSPEGVRVEIGALVLSEGMRPPRFLPEPHAHTLSAS